MNSNDPKKKSIEGPIVKYYRISVKEIVENEEQQTKYEKFLEACKKIFKSEAKKAVIAAVTLTTAASTALGGLAYAKSSNDIGYKGEQTAIEEMQTDINYNSYCVDMIRQLQDKKGINVYQQPEKLYKELAMLANNVAKLDHDSIIGAFAYLCVNNPSESKIYNEEAFNNFVTLLGGYNYGEKDIEKIKEMNENTAGIDFTTDKSINEIAIEGEKLFVRMGSKKFSLDKLVYTNFEKNPLPKEDPLEIIRTDEDRGLYPDLNEIAFEILNDKEYGDARLYQLYMQDRHIKELRGKDDNSKTDFDKLMEVIGFLMEEKDPEHVTVEDEEKNHITTIEDYANAKEMFLDEWFKQAKNKLYEKEMKEGLEGEFNLRSGR